MRDRFQSLLAAVIFCPVLIANANAGETEDIAQKLNKLNPASAGNSYVMEQYQFLMEKEIFRDTEMRAQMGDGHAQYLLADSYLNGRGVRRNDLVALMWYLISEQNGFDDASKHRKRIEHYMAFDRVRLAYNMAERWMDEH